MKSSFLFLFAIAASLSFTGCVFMNDEDKEFYGKGWVHPTELDQMTPRRDPTAAPAADTRAASSSAAPSQQSAPEWIVPETTQDRL